MMYISEKEALSKGCLFNFYENFQHVEVPFETSSGENLALDYAYALAPLVAKKIGCAERNLVLLVTSADKNAVVICYNNYVLSALKARYGGRWIGQAWLQDNLPIADLKVTLAEILA